MRDDAVAYDQLSGVESLQCATWRWLTELAQLAQTLPCGDLQQLRVSRDRFHDPDEVAPLSTQEGAKK